jgi:hypothetical protein
VTPPRSQIISASRRTDIPAFYTDWFMNRIRAGFAEYRNPFGGQPYRVSLNPQDVSCIVLWSRDYRPLLPHLEELERRGYASVFHFTITGLPSPLDADTPPADEAIETFRKLAGRFGPERVLWRYDPIVFSDLTKREYHLRRFRELASELQGATLRCHTSFLDFYKKVTRNLGKLWEKTGLECFDASDDEKKELASSLAEIAGEHGIGLHACCENSVVGGAVKRAHCVDAELIGELFPDKGVTVSIRPTRPGCGCYESRDIGAYDTCLHGCVYCYANANKGGAQRNARRHNPESPSLI